MRIGIVGGTGDFGRGLAGRLERLGDEVVLGSRTPRDEFVANDEAANAGEIVFLSVPPDGVEATAASLAGLLAGKILVSVASPVVVRGGVASVEAGDRSLAEAVSSAAPEARVVAAFHTVSAKALADAERPLDEDVLLAGDDAGAKEAVAELAGRLVAGRPVDAGPLEVARLLETLTAVLVNVNRRYRANTGVRITGLG